jgi:hypothetical protein
VTRYWGIGLIALAICAVSIVGIDWGIYHLVRTGNCGSSTTYISTRPCPPGTGGHILALIGGIFGGLIGVGVWAARGSLGRPSAIPLGLIMWSLLFVTLAASVAYAAYGPASTDSSGSHAAAIILGVIFVPMGLAPLPFALRSGRSRAQPVTLPPSAFRPPPASAFVAARPVVGTVAVEDEEDPLDRIAKLGELRDKGLITPEEFEAQKKRLLDEL